MEKIPKDLSRWLKDNNKFAEFIRLVRYCGYKVSDLAYKTNDDYGIKSWLNEKIETKSVYYKKELIRYDEFLDNLKLNWRKK